MELTNASNAGGNATDRFNSLVAVSVAICAAFMAVTKIKDNNIVQALVQSKTDAVDK